MRTTAFLARAGICLLLSLIPFTELENRIYSSRFHIRGPSGAVPLVQIVEVDFQSFNSPSDYSSLLTSLRQEHPRLVLKDENSALLQDSDGEIRRSILQPRDSADSLTYEAALLLNFSEAKLGAIHDPHWINYAGPAGTIPICRVTRAIGLKHCPSIQDKIVLVSEIERERTTYKTPFGEISRAEIIANDINTILGGNTIYYASPIEGGLVVLLMVLATAFYIIYYPVQVSAIAVAGTGILVLAVSFQFLLILFNIYVPSSNAFVAVLVTYLVFTGYRLSFQEELQWRSIKQAQYLHEVEQLKTNFLSLMSHDLKTPLAKIQAVTERLRREMSRDIALEDKRHDWRDLIDSIENSNNELKNYITSILNLSKIESQNVILRPKSNDINQLVSQCVKRLTPLAHQRNIMIEEKLEPLFSIECDEDLMRQVLSNLVDNAIKYSPASSKVVIRTAEENGFVRVDVEDFGPGISNDQLPLMFRKFSRFISPVNQMTIGKEQVKGTGLGLYLSKYFVELHHGNIRLKSEVGKGTTFTLTLPIIPAGAV